ncbi:hypothetical protein ACQP2F_08035 [Actinoplanes sp. CA-030573]|uniref:hypothetical protein n=1 Tax=Actinoplanes sp. CA-030573 TaxID=3239898 RepID=UPI003D92A0B9
MTGRPRRPHGGNGDDGGEPPDRHGGGGDDGGDEPPGHRGGDVPGPGDFGSVRRAEDGVAGVARDGRSNPAPGWRPSTSSGAGDSPSRPAHPDDVRLQRIMHTYDQLGDEPPTFNIASNDAAHDRAHTIDRHGPDLPMTRDPNVQTVEGRIYGDTGWEKAANGSYKWTDHTTMNREVNRYVEENWPSIRDDLAIDGSHENVFDAGHRIGEGYYNRGMHGAGPRQSQYDATSLVRIRIKVVEGSDPPVPFIVTAFPAGLG